MLTELTHEVDYTFRPSRTESACWIQACFRNITTFAWIFYSLFYGLRWRLPIFWARTGRVQQALQISMMSATEEATTIETAKST